MSYSRPEDLPLVPTPGRPESIPPVARLETPHAGPRLNEPDGTFTRIATSLRGYGPSPLGGIFTPSPITALPVRRRSKVLPCRPRPRAHQEHWIECRVWVLTTASEGLPRQASIEPDEHLAMHPALRVRHHGGWLVRRSGGLVRPSQVDAAHLDNASIALRN